MHHFTSNCFVRRTRGKRTTSINRSLRPCSSPSSSNRPTAKESPSRAQRTDMQDDEYVSEGVRPASHAGTWYESSTRQLQGQLEGWLDEVKLEEQTPVDGARVIIAPHAGYSYSGPCAAWAYKALDVSPSTKRVFVLGPSHTYYLRGMALTTFHKYATPLGDFATDTTTLGSLYSTGSFGLIPRKRDIEEHSLEMHIPYLYAMLKLVLPTDAEVPPIVPILIGDISGDKEKEAGRILAPYLSNPENSFIVSSDFCHWGLRFQYTAYVPSSTIPDSGPKRLRSSEEPSGQSIHESIKVLDDAAIEAIETGSHDKFLSNLRCTQNTVCGRHPIGVVMAAMEALNTGKKFKFVRYERSSLVTDVDDSSVSYGSAYAVL
ncbi:Protein MEMO1 [Zalerion maritima]|uniref:Protein MEMO1 n=1 Tax=Zalerion maritima TaxID=339359 RepID=A0AAD5WV78_9PEZI|nr:Protein MEMO1 [Zalerion maritima]